MATVYFVRSKLTTLDGAWVKAESAKAAKEFISKREGIPTTILTASKAKQWIEGAVVDAAAIPLEVVEHGVYAVGQKIWKNGDEWVIRTVPIKNGNFEYQLADAVEPGGKKGAAIVTPRYKDAETAKKQAAYKIANAIVTPQVSW